MVKHIATILGGLPVIADVSFGYDGFTGEYYSEVSQLFWVKKDGSPGKELPQHVIDKAEKYDPYFANLTENVSEMLASEAYENKPKEMFQLL